MQRAGCPRTAASGKRSGWIGRPLRGRYLPFGIPEAAVFPGSSRARNGPAVFQRSSVSWQLQGYSWVVSGRGGRRSSECSYALAGGYSIAAIV
jgi:hypothetical protein